MSQFNHLDDRPSTNLRCSECDKQFRYSVHDSSLYGGHDSEPIRCPWCGTFNGEVHGGDSLSVYTFKVGE